MHDVTRRGLFALSLLLGLSSSGPSLQPPSFLPPADRAALTALVARINAQSALEGGYLPPTTAKAAALVPCLAGKLRSLGGSPEGDLSRLAPDAQAQVLAHTLAHAYGPPWSRASMLAEAFADVASYLALRRAGFDFATDYVAYLSLFKPELAQLYRYEQELNEVIGRIWPCGVRA